jgi:hypothetical protein
MVADNTNVAMLQIRVGLYAGIICRFLCLEAAFFHSLSFAIDLTCLKNIAVCPAAFACSDCGHIINSLNPVLFKSDYTTEPASHSCADTQELSG